MANVQLGDTYNKNIEIVTEECTEDTVVLNVLNEKGDPELYVVSKQNENEEDIYDVLKYYDGRHYTIDKPFIDTKVAKYGSNPTVQEFIDNLDSNGILTVWDKDGKQLSSTDRVKTGMTLKATKGAQELTFTIVVKGDANGDGRVRTTDSEMLVKYLSPRDDHPEDKITDPIALRALDLNMDGKNQGRLSTPDLNEFYYVMAHP